jgi:phage shock protein E
MDNSTTIYFALALLAAYLVFQRLKARKAPAQVVIDKIKAGAKIVDVRTPGEFAGGSYPRAKNIPLESLASRMGELPKDKPIVLYCASGSRSAQAARALKKAGYMDVISAGGLGDMPR